MRKRVGVAEELRRAVGREYGLHHSIKAGASPERGGAAGKKGRVENKNGGFLESTVLPLLTLWVALVPPLRLSPLYR
jgi:hypothetical protein